MRINWNRLEEVYKLSRLRAVSFSMNYDESCDQWYFDIYSPATAENFVGKSRSYDIAIDTVLDGLQSIAP